MTEGGKELEHLVDLMAKLPGLGPRSARRAVLVLIKKRELLLDPLTKALGEVSRNVRECDICGNLGTTTTCDICLSPKRDPAQICIVEDVADLWAMERGRVFKGRYHILGGVLSALDGITPEDLHIPELISRIEKNQIKEVILALNATMDGQTTAHYIADQLQSFDVAVTSLAQGVPIGGELDYLDDGTISAALRDRKAF